MENAIPTLAFVFAISTGMELTALLESAQHLLLVRFAMELEYVKKMGTAFVTKAGRQQTALTKVALMHALDMEYVTTR